MKINWIDPIFLSCVGVLLAGCVSLLWALSKLIVKKPKAETTDSTGLDDIPILTDADPAQLVRAEESTLQALRERGARQSLSPVVPVSSAVGPVAGKEVADRLDAMAQRLTEMQTVLSQQAGQAAASLSTLGAAPRSFSPETVDKLLKIVGNVIHQVDLLQSSLNTSQSKSAPGVSEPPDAG
ncbi:MAG: hypothetical protein WC859_07265 [Elusimicrobiota bacterium]